MPDGPVRVLVHAGFHKTGTSSLQDFLRRNRAALKPWLDYYGKADFLEAGAAARRYGQRPFPWRLWLFRRQLRRFLATIPDAPLIVLSRETFAGVMPGHRDWRGRMVQGYAATAIPLARAVIAELRRRFGPGVRIEFLYTTRDRERWIRSVYGHLLRSIHLTEEFGAFRARFPDLAAPDEEARRIAAALPCPVHAARLEDHAAAPAGPATPVLDLAGVPAEARARLVPAGRSNVGQTPEMEAEFLRLNRSGKARAQLKRIKDRMLAEG
ncbi:hypothetical protein [Acidimangrovimonas pyrenivorans]|uniref:Sulfotransferase family protein n=1 Tax=Acidimangrovimonas pyrenivorans TaxID=2030798 RepID=A0ABV7AN08_9RHOB